MVKAGFLPNISGDFSFYKTLAIKELQNKDYNGATSALYSLNLCLTDDYLVKVSTKEYHELIKDKSSFQCQHCTMTSKITINEGEDDERFEEIKVPTEIPFNDVKVFDIINPLINSVLVGSSTSKCWTCPKCEKDNFQNNGEWNIVQSTRQKTNTLGVVPSNPVKFRGLKNRSNFHNEFCGWFWNFMEEIQAKMVLFRIEYIRQNGHDFDDSGFKDEGDK
ncbi:hypothetical protein [Nitrosopumilus sp. S6]